MTERADWRDENIVTPDSADRVWDPGQRPPAQWQNWFHLQVVRDLQDLAVRIFIDEGASTSNLQTPVPVGGSGLLEFGVNEPGTDIYYAFNATRNSNFNDWQRIDDTEPNPAILVLRPDPAEFTGIAAGDVPGGEWALFVATGFDTDDLITWDKSNLDLSDVDMDALTAVSGAFDNIPTENGSDLVTTRSVDQTINGIKTFGSPVPAPGATSDGELLTLGQFSGATRLKLTSNQTIGSGANTQIGLDDTLFDQCNGITVDLANDEMDIDDAGIYYVTAQIHWISDANWTNQDDIELLVSSGTITNDPIRYKTEKSGTDNESISLTGYLDLASGDSVSFSAFQNSGSSQNIDASDSRTYFMIRKVT